MTTSTTTQEFKKLEKPVIYILAELYNLQQSMGSPNLTREQAYENGIKIPRTKSIPTVDKIFDDKGKVQYLKYREGVAGIKKDDQSEDIEDVLTNIVFENGRLIVQPHQPELAHYLDNCNWNGTNENRNPKAKIIFYKMDEAKTKKEINEANKLRTKAVNMAYNMPKKRMYDFALAMGIDVERDEEEIRYDLSQIAEKSPTQFINDYEDAVIKLKGMMARAQKQGIIKFDDRNSVWKWGENDQPLVNVPSKMNALDVFVEFVAKEQNVNIYEYIDSRVE